MARLKSEDRREALLTAATQVFAERGLAAPTSAISAAAGVSEGSLFTYFKTKDELVNVLYRELKLGQADAVMAGFPRRSSVRQRMEHVWTKAIAWGLEYPIERQAFKQLRASNAITEETRAAGWAPFAEVERITKDAVEQRLLRDLPGQMVVKALAALGEMTMDLMAEHPDDAARYQTLGFEMFWGAVTAKR
jgi:AcrR family transcriptional regulator